MSRPVPNPAKHSVATAQPLLLGAHVHLHSDAATGVVIGYSPERDCVLVRWNESGKVTRCLRSKLAPLR
jgi:hypothetical protein